MNDKIKQELKRYNMLIDQDGMSVEELWCEHGCYVKYSEIKDIIKSRDKEIEELQMCGICNHGKPQKFMREVKDA